MVQYPTIDLIMWKCGQVLLVVLQLTSTPMFTGCMAEHERVDSILIDNTKPRTDTNGDIVNAHQGKITRFEGVDGAWRYYWVGSAWVPCRPLSNNTTCVDGSNPTSTGKCLEPKENGCLSMAYGACGFNNNNISVYSSATLGNANWRIETKDALSRSTREIGEYWQPNFDYNPTTRKYVMWWIYSKPGTTLGVVQSAVADAAGGPYVIVNNNVTLKYKSFTSANLFVDRSSTTAPTTTSSTAATAPTAYVMYSSFRVSNNNNNNNNNINNTTTTNDNNTNNNNNHQNNNNTNNTNNNTTNGNYARARGSKFPAAAVIEQLDATWTNTVSPARASEQFGVGEGGVLFRWDSGVGVGGSDNVGDGDGVGGVGVSVGVGDGRGGDVDDGDSDDGGGGGGGGITTVYYALEGMGCCFCPQGSDLIAWKASSVLGPWSPVNNSTSINPPYTPPPPTTPTTPTVPTAPPSSSSPTTTAAPLTPEPPAPAPHCHGCQVGSCCVPRVWELPTQQQGVTTIPTTHINGCEGGVMMWSGDAWQQAPDDLKQHDPQWWVPLCFDTMGNIGNLSAVEQWRLQSA